VLEVIIVKDTTMRGHNVQMMVSGPTISAKLPFSVFQRLARPGNRHVNLAIEHPDRIVILVRVERRIE
jgi:hypothetical protein